MNDWAYDLVGDSISREAKLFIDVSADLSAYKFWVTKEERFADDLLLDRPLFCEEEEGLDEDPIDEIASTRG